MEIPLAGDDRPVRLKLGQAGAMIGPGIDVPVRLHLLLCLCVIASVLPAAAQDDAHAYAGVLVGFSVLSADARAIVEPLGVRASLYKPETGPSVNGFFGLHAHRFVSLQANYIWNRNRVTTLSSVTAPDGGSAFERELSSMQSAIIGDVLVYVRARESRVRPYFSIGVGAVRFDNDRVRSVVSSDTHRGSDDEGSTRAGLRIAVGIDLALGSEWRFRYSYSDTVGSNPFAELVDPPGQRSLANFQSLFGLVRSL